MKHLAVVIAPERFRDEELFIPLHLWREADLKVSVLSTTTAEVIGDLGGRYTPTALRSSLVVDDYDAIVVIGGSGTVEYLWQDAGLRDQLRAFDRTNKPVAGICAGAVVVAQAGLLVGRPATTYPDPSFIAKLQAYGAIYQPGNVVTSGRMVTGNGPMGAADFAAQVRNLVLAPPPQAVELNP